MEKAAFLSMAYLSQSSNTMSKKFTYKELTLLLGIIVALIVIFTLWIRQPSDSFSITSKTQTESPFAGFKKLFSHKKSTIGNYLNGFAALFSDRSNPY